MDVHEVASVEELRGAGRVIGAAWQDGFANILPSSVLEDVVDAKTTDIEAKFETVRERDREVGFVAVECGDVRGFARLVLDDERTESFVDAGDIELRMLYVDPDAQGVGVGSARLDACFERARHSGADRLVLETFTANADGRGFYEANDFERVGVSTFEIGGEKRETVVYVRPV